MAREDGAGLSLRSMARTWDGPVGPYRYFDSRDALLTALVLAAYEALADQAAGAADQRRTTGRRSDPERWPVVPRVRRAWALARPHEWGLIFGTPVPGSRPPRRPRPYTRLTAALVRPVVAPIAAGAPQPGRPRRRAADAAGRGSRSATAFCSASRSTRWRSPSRPGRP